MAHILAMQSPNAVAQPGTAFDTLFIMYRPVTGLRPALTKLTAALAGHESLAAAGIDVGPNGGRR